MRRINIIIFSLIFLITSCNKENVSGNSEFEALIGPASVGGKYQPFYFIIQKKDDRLLSPGNSNEIPKLYFMLNGEKNYNSSFLMAEQSNAHISWNKLGLCSENQQFSQSDSILSDGTIYKLNEEYNIKEFYLEWSGKEIGKIYFDSIIINGKKMVKVKFNDDLIKSSKQYCIPLFIFKAAI
jgi:hypothetical protein